ncbi:hypothetical protein [Methylobacterium gregans]|uniref:hypothetical protein n=1 Tax=Methylobacterium gregans TaxID=374424 RepID=UPI00361A92BD
MQGESERRVARAGRGHPADGTDVRLPGRPDGERRPPILSAVAEVRPIGELLYGRRFTRELAEDLGKDPRQLRRWLSGEAAVPERAVRWAREAARRRAREILALVGAEA